MNVAYIGTGYVGTVSAAVTAKKDHKVYCVDLPEKVKFIKNELAKGRVHIYEPGLKEIFDETTASKKLVITDSIEEAVRDSQLVFITVGTPSNPDGSVNLDAVYKVADDIAHSFGYYRLIVVKSTVPPGTTDLVKKRIAEKTHIPFDVAMNPEFLREGRAVEDSEKPDRIVIGVDSEKAENMLREFYKAFTLNNNPIQVVKPAEAEIIKYASNAHLALRISISNEIANLCDKVGADYKRVREGVGADKRIGKEFLYAGMGYGGSCFPKDIKGLIAVAKILGLRMKILESVDEVNEEQKLKMHEKISDYFENRLEDKTFGVWGLAFKPKTDDIREAPALKLIENLAKNGSRIKAYDPKAMENARKYFSEKGLENIVLTNNKEDAVVGSDALVLCTEWDDFRNPDFEFIKDNLKYPVVFDGKNIYDSEQLKALKIRHIGIGTGN